MKKSPGSFITKVICVFKSLIKFFEVHKDPQKNPDLNDPVKTD